MSELYKPRPDRLIRFRFGLRTLFLLLTLFGVWLGVQVKWIRDREAALKILNSDSYHQPGLPTPAPWSIRVLGAPGYRLMWVRTRMRPDEDIEDDMSRLKVLFPEARVAPSPFGGRSFTRREAVERMRQEVAGLEAELRAAAPNGPFTQHMIKFLRSQKQSLAREEAKLISRPRPLNAR